MSGNNALIADWLLRFNRTARHEWLDLHYFESVEHAQFLATQWQWTYNNKRPKKRPVSAAISLQWFWSHQGKELPFSRNQ